MPLTPMDVQKMRFSQKMRGYDPEEVEEFLSVVADEIVEHLGEIERLKRENRAYRQRVEEVQNREGRLQDTLLRAQKVSEGINESAKKEARLLVQEAEMTADRVVQQALEQSTKIEAKIAHLRAARRELQLKLKNTLELFESVLEQDMEDDESTATVRTMPPRRKEA